MDLQREEPWVKTRTVVTRWSWGDRFVVALVTIFAATWVAMVWDLVSRWAP